MEVDIYTVRNCIKCKEVKAYLSSKGIGFIEHDMGIGGRPELQAMKKYFKEVGLKTYPVTIVLDKKAILQGFDKKEFDEVFNG